MFDHTAEVARRRKLLLVPGLVLLVAVSKIVYAFSSTTEQQFRDVCGYDTPGMTGTYPCHPHGVEVVAAWRAPVLVVVIVVIVTGVLLLYAYMPRLTHTPPEADPADIAPLKGTQRRRGLTLRLQPALRGAYLAFATAFLVGAALLFFAVGASVAVSVVLAMFGAMFLHLAGASSVTVTPEALTARMLLFHRRWTWDVITRISAADSFTRRGHRIRLLLVETTTGKPFAREALSSPPGGKRIARADRVVAAIEEYRASLGHFDAQRVRR